MIFDSHAHYEDKKFDQDRVELLSMMNDNNIGRIVNVGSTLNTSIESIDLANSYKDVYAAVGIHPSEVAFPIDGDEDNTFEQSRMPDVLSRLEDLSKDGKCVAIGEIGFDYYWDKEEENHKLQREWFIAQLELA
nr:TatD family hydrolase [Lachnospiraceae bacterium]